MTVEGARKIILRQPDAVESEHHGHPDFRVANKIFATLWPDQDRSVLRLPLEVAEEQERANPDRCRVVSRSGGAGWLSVDLKSWTQAEFKPLAELARSIMKDSRKAKK